MSQLRIGGASVACEQRFFAAAACGYEEEVLPQIETIGHYMKGFSFNEMLDMTDREREWFYKRAEKHFERLEEENRRAKQRAASIRGRSR